MSDVFITVTLIIFYSLLGIILIKYIFLVLFVGLFDYMKKKKYSHSEVSISNNTEYKEPSGIKAMIRFFLLRII